MKLTGRHVALAVVLVAATLAGRPRVERHEDTAVEPAAGVTVADLKRERAALVAANRDWWQAVRSQIFLVLTGSLSGVVTIGYTDAGPDTTGRSVSSFVKHWHWTGQVSTPDALAAVVGLVTLVGALAIALVAGARVVDSDALLDRWMVARWGQVVTAISPLAAGVALGIATTQSFAGPNRGTGAVMLLVALLACALSAVSVQRRNDEVSAGLARGAELRLQDSIERLQADVVRRHQTWLALCARSILPYIALPVVLAAYTSVRHIARQDGLEWPRWSTCLLFVGLVGLQWFVVSPFRRALTGRLRYGKADRRDPLSEKSWWRWLGACMPAALVTLLFLSGLLSEQYGAATFLKAEGVVAVLPLAVALLLTRLALANRGPWASVRVTVLESERSQYRLALERRTAFESQQQWHA